jgi:hypothetical protein
MLQWWRNVPETNLMDILVDLARRLVTEGIGKQELLPFALSFRDLVHYGRWWISVKFLIHGIGNRSMHSECG